MSHPLSNLTPRLFSQISAVMSALQPGQDYVVLPDRHNRELRSAGLFPVPTVVGRALPVWSWGSVFGVRVVTRRYADVPEHADGVRISKL